MCTYPFKMCTYPQDIISPDVKNDFLRDSIVSWFYSGKKLVCRLPADAKPDSGYSSWKNNQN